MRGVATWVWIIVAVVGAVAIIYLGMSYGIIPIGGEVGKWFCYQRFVSPCQKYVQGDKNVEATLETLWESCGKTFFGEEYTDAKSFCMDKFSRAP